MFTVNGEKVTAGTSFRIKGDRKTYTVIRVGRKNDEVTYALDKNINLTNYGSYGKGFGADNKVYSADKANRIVVTKADFTANFDKFAEGKEAKAVRTREEAAERIRVAAEEAERARVDARRNFLVEAANGGDIDDILARLDSYIANEIEIATEEAVDTALEEAEASRIEDARWNRGRGCSFCDNSYSGCSFCD